MFKKSIDQNIFTEVMVTYWWVLLPKGQPPSAREGIELFSSHVIVYLLIKTLNNCFFLPNFNLKKIFQFFHYNLPMRGFNKKCKDRFLDCISFLDNFNYLYKHVRFLILTAAFQNWRQILCNFPGMNMKIERWISKHFFASKLTLLKIVRIHFATFSMLFHMTITS